MSAYRFTVAGRPVYVMGRAGRWWYAVDALPAIGDTLTGPAPTRAAAIAAATEQLTKEANA